MIFLTGSDKAHYQTLLRSAAESVARMDSLMREITRLEQRIEDFRREWAWERERADRATDALLASKGLPTIMPENPRGPDVMDDPYAAEDPKEVEKMLKAMGLERKHVEA